MHIAKTHWPRLVTSVTNDSTPRARCLIRIWKSMHPYRRNVKLWLALEFRNAVNAVTYTKQPCHLLWVQLLSAQITALVRHLASALQVLKSLCESPERMYYQLNLSRRQWSPTSPTRWGSWWPLGILSRCAQLCNFWSRVAAILTSILLVNTKYVWTSCQVFQQSIMVSYVHIVIIV